MKCDICESDTEKWNYSVSYSLPITRLQKFKGVFPTGDKLLRVCEKCNSENIHFHDPEKGKIVRRLDD